MTQEDIDRVNAGQLPSGWSIELRRRWYGLSRVDAFGVWTNPGPLDVGMRIHRRYLSRGRARQRMTALIWAEHNETKG